MRIRFLTGPAGSGKTYRCLSEIRRELAARPEGPPLIFLAPKQATYQLERQLFESGEVQGYTRLRIVSFERLAGFITTELGAAPPRVISDEGRLMVLRALLLRHGGRLAIYRGSAARAGFVQELSDLLRELQQHRVSPAALQQIARSRNPGDALGLKLADLALLLEAYAAWLHERDLRDTDYQIEYAAETLRQQRSSDRPESVLQLGGLWLDGFAELTPHERWLLLALVPHTPTMTLTFCLESPEHKDAGWLSGWAPAARLYRECLDEFSAQPDAQVVVETVPRQADAGRFTNSGTLAHLEKHWADGQPFAAGEDDASFSVSLVQCSNPEGEAVLASREIRRFVRGGGRYREAAILLRNMEVYGEVLPRILTRYEIPFFIDRRVAMAHHPLAELTHYALRILCHHWRAADLFGAWKTGFFPIADEAVDRLENESLANGWEGETWRSPLPPEGAAFERARRELVQPLEEFTAALGGAETFNGLILSKALARFWDRLGVETKLAGWDYLNKNLLHGTVWNEMQTWLKNLEFAFHDQALSRRDWLATVEAGLAGLTVGAVPPALDQVLIGTVDRSRNPDLQLTVLLGMNEGVFPLAPPTPKLLTESERATLGEFRFNLPGDRREFLGRERFFGYIACTRSRQRLVMAFSSRSLEGEVLNPSPFIGQVRAVLPGLRVEVAEEHFGWENGEHPTELLGQALREEHRFERSHQLTALLNLPAIQNLSRRLPIFRAVEKVEPLPKELAGQLFGRELRTSVSALEKFAACPFQFFAHHTLRGRERPEFELGPRERGSFIHEILSAYHEKLAGQGRAWRALSAEEARRLVREVAENVSQTFNHGLMNASAAARFEKEVVIRRLEEFIRLETSWMSRYAFDPWKAELRFGSTEGEWPAWRIEVGDGRAVVLEGKIDRVDLGREADSEESQIVVIDYKMRGRGAKLDTAKMEHGITMQLPAYLNVLRDGAVTGRNTKLIPTGMFYAPLTGEKKAEKRRNENLASRDPEEDRWRAFQFRGRFVGERVKQFDNQAQAGSRGSHFAFRINKDEAFVSRPEDPTPEAWFEALLDQNVETIRNLGRRIFEGESGLDPYRKGNETACDYCDCQAICRVNPWTQAFRSLPLVSKGEKQPS